MKPSFILHTDSLGILEKLSNEQKGILFDAIYRYHLGELIELDPLMDIVFTPFKNQFERDFVKYENIVNRNRFNGQKGGRPNNIDNQANNNNPKKPKETQKTQWDNYEPKETQNNPNNLDSDSDNDSVNDNVSDSDSKNDISKSDKPITPKQPKLNNEELFNKKREAFKIEVWKFNEKYSVDLLAEFYRYWSEKQTTGWKMKWELQKTFEIDRRLVTWLNNQKKFNGNELPANVGGGSLLKAL